MCNAHASLLYNVYHVYNVRDPPTHDHNYNVVCASCYMLVCVTVLDCFYNVYDVYIVVGPSQAL